MLCTSGGDRLTVLPLATILLRFQRKEPGIIKQHSFTFLLHIRFCECINSSQLRHICQYEYVRCAKIILL